MSCSFNQTNICALRVFNALHKNFDDSIVVTVTIGTYYYYDYHSQNYTYKLIMTQFLLFLFTVVNNSVFLVNILYS